MSYLVFARKWRPQNFDEVIGQEHIATTLKNAITLRRVGHAYLFSGPRGIGKTSTARILAKALNCQKGSVPSPCNSCDNCREISEGRSLDVIEIDGASNRGIEQIRQLRENVKFASAKSRFKIYIIDEVHQITTDGFNALLKTLEEPPPHVKFIFATTQAFKVLPTVLSRCQRFNFRPLAVSFVMDKLKRIVKVEKLSVTDEALLYIARSAAGSMRDAESILDQMTSFSQGTLKLETVTSMLGVVDLRVLEEITQKIIARKTTEALILAEKVINEGKDFSQLITGLTEYFRNILITKVINSKDVHNFIDLPQEYLLHVSEQGQDLSFEELFYIFNVLMRAQENLRRALSSRVVVEMAIIRLTQRENLSSLEEILTKVTQLEQNIQKAELSLPLQDDSSDEENKTQIHKSSETFVQEHSPTAGNDHEGLENSWSQLLQAIRKEKMFLASSLEFGKITNLKDNVLTITFPAKYNFYQESLDRPENKKFIETKAKEVFRHNLKIEFILDKDLQPAVSQNQEMSLEDSQKEASAEPIIKSALKIFKGRVIKRNL